MKKLSCFVGILVLVFSVVGCRSVTVRWLNGGEPVDNPCKWECYQVCDDVCIPYLTEWDHDTVGGGGF